jgi:D-beta-D-heptose 7-phosphate kinase/D-beta-D-heptose 1-phosphate adenosyltransferase
VDPKGRDFDRYRLATVIKPNLKELTEATGIAAVNNASQELAARKLLDLTEAEFILLTRGAAGMLLVPRNRPPVEFSALAREVYDVSGAGDTVAAVLAAALGSGAGILEAVELANIAAGIVVGKVGTAVVERSEIADEIGHDLAITASSRILRVDEAMDRIRAWRRDGRRVVITLGSLDPLSMESLKALEEARSRCDNLVVVLVVENDSRGNDSRGKCSPQEVQTRAFQFASLANVDGVVVCDSPTAAEDVAALRAEASGAEAPSPAASPVHGN